MPHTSLMLGENMHKKQWEEIDKLADDDPELDEVVEQMDDHLLEVGRFVEEYAVWLKTISGEMDERIAETQTRLNKVNHRLLQAQTEGIKKQSQDVCIELKELRRETVKPIPSLNALKKQIELKYDSFWKPRKVWGREGDCGQIAPPE